MSSWVSRCGAFVVASVISTSAIVSTASAMPLDATWTRVGLAKPDDTANLFDGACNLQLTGCTYGTSGSGLDYWTSFAGANEILFITGNRQFWGQALYADVKGLVDAAGQVFSPNLTWISAGRNGSQIAGTVVGNILMRNFFAEDPWVTLQGWHCEFGCSEILWGESGFYSGSHATLMNNHGGLEVYARGLQGQGVPEPLTLALVGFGLAGLGALRRKPA